MFAKLPPPTYRFLARIVDYAGTFPPAKLPLGEAIEAMLRHRLEWHAWMLGRMVLTIPDALLLEPLADRRRKWLEKATGLLRAAAGRQTAEFGLGLSTNRRLAFWRRIQGDLRERDRVPLRFALIGTVAPEAAAAPDALRRDLVSIGAFHAMQGGSPLADTLEVRLPADLARRAEAAPITALLRDLHRILEAEAPAPVRLFVESTTGEHDGEAQEALVAGIAEHLRLAEHGRTAPMGFKLRTGGTEAAAFPPPEVVARAIAAAARAGVAMKATAGLHHPVRHADEATSAMMHGFLNVFGAAVLAHARGLTAKELEPILREEDGRSFAFTEEAFAWRTHRASAEEVAAARKALATSFGCCDFGDPVKGLKRLGILS